MELEAMRVIIWSIAIVIASLGDGALKVPVILSHWSNFGDTIKFKIKQNKTN